MEHILEQNKIKKKHYISKQRNWSIWIKYETIKNSWFFWNFAWRKKIEVEFISVDQTINYRSVIYKKTDKFSKLEDVIYEEYHQLKKGNYYFIVNGEIADKNKTLEENKIKNKDIITIIEIEKSFFV